MERLDRSRAPFLPDEPADSNDPGDVEHWVTVYTELLQGLTDIGDKTPSPEVLTRIIAADARLRWWVQRRVDLQTDSPGARGRRPSGG